MSKYLPFILLISIMLLTACSASEKLTEKDSTNQNFTYTELADTESSADSEKTIASLSIHLTSDLLALGIIPEGSVVGGKSQAYLPHTTDKLKDTKQLGEAGDVNLEALLTLKPDVIYIDEELTADATDDLVKIADTKSVNLDEGTWRDHLNQIAKATGKDEEEKNFIEEYTNEAEEVGNLIKDKVGEDAKAMAIRINAKELRVFSTGRPMGPLLFDDIGLQPAKGIEKLDPNRPYEVISKEVLPDYDPDIIFLMVNSESEAKAAFKDLENSSIWKGLKAVQTNRVYIIEEQPWLDYSALGNKLALDEAKKLFN
ncbi:ABC transporter substrate-binding protein [Terribacillus sp. 179-K 1B1 HS]|uniref:ABC transporter substrate-binding protein n=1 Tax=Terribacillus sp. 179-K 1B1 HS TaxID=3142388 RepID=UPI0039A2511D